MVRANTLKASIKNQWGRSDMWANIDPMSSPSLITDQASNTLIDTVTIINFSELSISAIENNHFCENH